MKTAEEWQQEIYKKTHPTSQQHVDYRMLEEIKQIQLDAFKAGMTEAAKCSNVIC